MRSSHKAPRPSHNARHLGGLLIVFADFRELLDCKLLQTYLMWYVPSERTYHNSRESLLDHQNKSSPVILHAKILKAADGTWSIVVDRDLQSLYDTSELEATRKEIEKPVKNQEDGTITLRPVVSNCPRLEIHPITPIVFHTSLQVANIWHQQGRLREMRTMWNWLSACHHLLLLSGRCPTTLSPILDQLWDWMSV